MSNAHNRTGRLPVVLASLSGLALAAALPSTPAFAEGGDRPVVSDKKPTASNATINLVNVLVQQGVITPEQAIALVKQAEDEAYVARQSARDANAKAEEAAKTAAGAAAAAAPPGSKRVTYVPEVVKRQLREDIRKEVMTQAQAEGWASPGKYPEWASRIRLSGDIRGRWEDIFMPDGGGATVYDFNAINNSGSGYDTSSANTKWPPSYNTTEDRNRARLRARLGLDADLTDGFSAGMRLATGSDASPVSTNQTLGGSGGNFSKYSIWLDRGFVKFEPFKHPQFNTLAEPSSATVLLGRFDNPFWAPTPLMWNADLGFDGLALQGRHEVVPGVTAFAAAGAFPIFNTALDFASTEHAKFDSEDKYLFGGQIGFTWKASPEVSATFGAGLYDFSNVRGRLSSPCDLSTATACDTDGLRPTFAQKGNTYMALRDIIPNAANGQGANSQFQYFGLASGYRPIELSGRLDLGYFDPTHIAIDGAFIWNSAFDRHAAERYAVNNRGPLSGGSSVGAFEGGDIGWLARVTVGQQRLAQFGDWNAHIGYKYLESDATMDAFAESDFGLGGTNLQGYFIGANIGLAPNVSASAKWMSASAIAGERYSADLLQFDFNAKF